MDDLAPGLTQRPGIGPVTAAQTIVAFSHPGRCRNDAAFASLAGTCPIPASSGRTVRHRLNRGGDRALNRAIHTIATVRMRDCPATQAYIARRTAEGKTIREIKRCLKRYITRELYRSLTARSTTWQKSGMTASSTAIAWCLCPTPPSPHDQLLRQSEPHQLVYNRNGRSWIVRERPLRRSMRPIKQSS